MKIKIQFVSRQINFSNVGVVHPNTHKKPTRKQQMMNTVAHELGHGAFRLKHPFDEFTSCYGSGGKDKDNLEDYYDGDFLRKYQWFIIKDKVKY